MIFKKIYVELLQIQKYTTSSNYLIIMLLKCALLFIVCISIEKLRQLIFKLIGLIIKKIQSKLKKWFWIWYEPRFFDKKEARFYYE